MKRFFTILIARTIIILSKFFGNNGSTLPGKIAFKIDNKILKKLSNEIKKSIIIVSGTNGKTTTNNMICQILEEENNKVVCNKIGANMYYGIVTAFIEKTSFLGYLNADYATLEIDEFSAIRILKDLNPNYFVLTNIFRDQLDRYGEIDIIIKKLKEGLNQVDNNIKYILNGDDPLSCNFGNKNNTIYYGIEKTLKNNNIDETKESRFCPYCNEKLKYNFYHYSQLGDYFCKKCSFKRPILDFEAKKISFKNGISFNLFFKEKEYYFSTFYSGFYNIYNIIAAISLVNELEISMKISKSTLKKYKPQIGRMERFFLKKLILLNLSKNPTGFNQSIKIILEEKEELDIILILNDKPQDGEDISWIWDVQFKKLKKNNILNFYIAGTRSYEIALRLKYENILENKINVYDNLFDSLKNCINKGKGKKIFILSTYTALFKVRKWLKKNGALLNE